MKTKHSKTPWTLKIAGIDDCGDKHTFNYIEVAKCRYITCEGNSEEEANENAKYIVKCVNHFDEMKEILEAIVDDLDYADTFFDVEFNRESFMAAKQLLEKLEQCES